MKGNKKYSAATVSELTGPWAEESEPILPWASSPGIVGTDGEGHVRICGNQKQFDFMRKREEQAIDS